MKRKLVVFPTDPLYIYLRKGEIKERYFNPGEFFDEVHVIDMSDKELTPGELKKVSVTAGKKKLVVHYFRAKTKIGILLLRKKVLEEIRRIRPDCIKAHGVFHEGYVASYCAKKTGTPLVLSIHGNYNHHQYLVMFRENFWQGFLLWLFQRLFLRRIVKQTDEFIYVYRQALNTTKGFRIPEGRKHLIYNKVFYDYAYDANRKRSRKFTIIYVGNFFRVKNQKFLLEVIKDLDVRFTLIGKGHNLNSMVKYAEKLGVRDKVDFIEAVPNQELHRYYADADCFMSATMIQEISIPVIEAMASGLPILHRKPLGREFFCSGGELVDDAFSGMYLVDYDKDAYVSALKKFMGDRALLRKYSRRSREVFSSKMSGSIMEQKEREVYRKLLERKQKEKGKRKK
jgi:glycosyltransferase involved in cell wall biosynthesis